MKISLPHTRSTFRLARLFTAILATMFMLIGLSTFAAQQASAQSTCSGGSWSNLKWQDGSPSVENGVYTGSNGFANAQFTWTADSNAKAGDTIELTLPPQLEPADLDPVPLKNSSGIVVANGNWSGHTFVITLTDFVETNFNVEGDAYVSVQWATTSEFDGDLNFSGCGTGSLPGKLTVNESGFTHEDSKRGTYRRYDSEIDAYKMEWSIGVNPREHKGQPIVVEDQAPEGWSFVCDAGQNDGYSPISVSSFIMDGQGNPTNVRHVIYDSNGNPGGGQTNGITNLDDPDMQTGHNYTILCSPELITVTFPYGLYVESGPVINAITTTKTKPAPGSTVTNTASIDGTEVSDGVLIPGAGGQGHGLKGGFTVEKILNGATAEEAGEFEFNFVCKNPQGAEAKSGTFKLAAGSLHHESELDKDLSCEITETSKDLEGKERTTSWSVTAAGSDDATFNHSVAGDSATVTIASPDVEAAHLVVTNAYSPVTPAPKTSGFKVKKVVEGTDAEDAFKFSWTCSEAEGDSKTGTVELKHNEEVSISGIAIGSDCSVTEIDPAEVDGFDHKLELTVDGKPVTDADSKFTVAEDREVAVFAKNLYTKIEQPDPKPEVAGFNVKKVVEGTSVTDAFEFEWKCTSPSGDAESSSIWLHDGNDTSVDGFEVGSECTVSEIAPAKVDGFDHKLELTINGKVVDGSVAKFTLEKDKEIGVVAKNIYTKTTPPVPTPDVTSLSLKKLVEGAPVGDAFEFEWKCQQPEGEEKNGVVQLKDKEVAIIKDLLVGSECTISEKTPRPVDGFKHKLQWTVDNNAVEGAEAKFSLEKGKEVAVVAKNIYTETDKPEPTPPSTTTTTTTVTSTPPRPNVPIIPIPIPIPSSPSGKTTIPAPTQPAQPVPSTPSAPSEQSQDKPHQEGQASDGARPSKHLRANTGATVMELLLPLLAFVALAGGLFLFLRRQQENES